MFAVPRCHRVSASVPVRRPAAGADGGVTSDLQGHIGLRELVPGRRLRGQTLVPFLIGSVRAPPLGYLQILPNIKCVANIACP